MEEIGIQYKIDDNKRFLWLDIAKGVTILLTIIGHSIGSGRIKVLIYSFHMPLFFVLAGYTFKKTTDLTEIKEKIRKDAARLILPYMLVCCIRIIIEVLFYNKGIHETIAKYLTAYVLGYGNPYMGQVSVGVVWFLLALFWSKVAYRFVLLYVKQYRQMFILMMGFASVWIGQIIRLPQNFDLIFVNMIFMEAGYLLKEYEAQIRQEIMQGVGVVFFFIWTVYMHLCNGKVRLDLSLRKFDKYTLGILIAILASLCIIQFCRAIESWKISEGAAFLGKHTLALLCVHQFDGLIKTLWNKQSPTVLFFQHYLEKVLTNHDMMKMYDGWCNVLTNAVVIVQRVLLDVLVLLLFLYIRKLILEAKQRYILAKRRLT